MSVCVKLGVWQGAHDGQGTRCKGAFALLRRPWLTSKLRGISYVVDSALREKV